MKHAFSFIGLGLLIFAAAATQEVRAGTWSHQPWTDDASMGLSSTDTLWAYHFGNATTATVSGVSIPGLAGPPPVSAAGKVEVGGLVAVLDPDFNNLTSQTGTGSATIGSSFFYGGNPTATITLKAGAGSLQQGEGYRVSLFSAGWDEPPDTRNVKFVSGTDELAIDQNVYGNNAGLRVDYDFVAGAGDQVINVQVNNANSYTYHLYAVALTKVSYASQVALISSLNPSQPGQSVTFTATVTAPGGGGQPTGTVTFLDGASPLAGPVPLNGSGVAAISTSALTAGNHNITATYNGSPVHATSTSNTVAQLVGGTFTVTTSADSGPGSLRDTVAAAPAGSTIRFDSSLDGKPILLTSGEIILDKSLLIDAASFLGVLVIHGNEVNRLFYIAAGASVEFRNLTLTGGGGTGAANTDRGGGVLNAGTLTCTDCRFTGNKGAFGGAIATGYSAGNTSLTLRRCWIFDNTGTSHGGGIIQTANTNNLTSTLVMEECTMENNRSTGAGGGLYCQSGSAGGTITASLRQCTLRGNTAAADGGGGIFSRASGTSGTSAAHLTLVHCTVTNNTARYGGGVATATDYGCPTSLTLTGSIIAGNHSPSAVDVGRQGGAFTSGGGNLIGSTTLSHIDTWAATDLKGTDATPLDARLAASGFYGGPVPTCPPLPGSPALDAAAAVPAIATDQRGLPRVLDADSVPGAVADIGAVESVFAQVDVADDELDVPAGAGDVSLREALRDAPAGAIITFAAGLSGQTMTLNDTLGSLTVTKEVGLDASSLLPGGFTLRRTGTTRLLNVNTGTSLSLNHLRISGPGASGAVVGMAGGAISATGKLSLTGCDVSGHSSSLTGGAIFTSTSLLILRGCTLSGNSSALNGGGCTAFSCVVSATGCTFSGNEAQSHGGGLHLNKSLGCLSQCTFSSNRGLIGGGAIRSDGGLRLSFCTLTGNTTAGGGGGIYTGGSAVPVALGGTIVAGNSADSTDQDLSMLNSPVFLRSGPNLIGDNSGSSVFPAGLPNVNGDYVGTTAAPVDALLGPLADNGGPTQTCLPLVGSPAIDHATANLSPRADARGFPRNQDGDDDFNFLPDIGATEFGTDPVLVVNTLADELDTPAAGATLSLREALRQAPAGAVITFAPALNGQTLVMDATKGGFTLERSVTVDASSLPAGLTLDAGTGDNRHGFVDKGAHVAFNRITFTGGSTVSTTTEPGRGYGGSLYLNVGNVVLTDCTLRDNTATFGGGAIFIGTEICRLVMSRCTLHRNQVPASGTSFRTGGALYAATGFVDLDHCTFTANQAPVYGGAGYFLNVQMEANHCTITGNATTLPGGAGGGFLYFNSPVDRLRISNSIVCGNAGFLDLYVDTGAFLSGGGNVGGPVQPSFNQPTDINNITDPFQIGLAELGRYGGLTDTMPPMPGSVALDRAAGSTATTDQRGFARNFDGDFNSSAVSDSGAAESFIVRSNILSDELQTPSGNNVSLREAVRDAPAGAVITTTQSISYLNLSTGGELRLDKPLILAGNNSTWGIASPSSRALYVAPGTRVHLHRVALASDNLSGSDGGKGTGAVASGKGGAILNQGTLSMTNCTVRIGTADYGGGIANGLAATPSTLIMRRCSLYNNTASTYGGALYNASANGGAATATLESCRIYGNTSGRHGGALVNIAGNGPASLTLLHCTLAQNSALSSGGGLYTGISAGGSSSAVSTSLTSSIIALNTAPQGPDVQLTVGALSSLTNLIGVADSGGSGLQQVGGNLTGTLAAPLDPGLFFTEASKTFNPLPGSPAMDAADAAAASLVILDAFRQTRTVDGDADGTARPDIGALEAATISVTTVVDELDTPAGPNVSLREALRDAAASNAIIRLAPALNGGTLTLDAAKGEIAIAKSVVLDASALPAGFTLDAGTGTNRIFGISAGPVRLSGLTLRNGKGDASGGGAILITGGDVTLDRCVLRDNTSLGGGGALAYTGGTGLRLNQCSFSGNSCTSFGSNGGALRTSSNSLRVILTGCSFTANTSATNAGAIHWQSRSQGSNRMSQCTLAGNRAAISAGGILIDGGSLSLDHCTMTGNEAINSSGGGLRMTNAVNNQLSTLNNCVVAGNRALVGPDVSVHSSSTGALVRTGANVIGQNTDVTDLFPAPAVTGSANANGDYVGTVAAPMNALLAPAGNYGGPASIETCPPMPGSPALDRAAGTSLTTDARGAGFARAVDGDFNGSAIADIGAAESVMVRVDVADDELDEPAGTNDLSLREALRDAPEGAVISFVPALSGQTLTLGAAGALVLPGSVIISASGLTAPVTLTPQAGNRIFYLPSQRSLGLSHLNLTGANVPGAYGAAIISDGSLSLSDCSLTANISGIDGGAVAVNGSSLAINRCVFSGNQAGNGGAIVLLSFGLSMNPRLSVQDSVFQTNSCADRGGAISHYAQGGGSCQATVRRSLFSGNQASRGGAVHHWANGGRSEVTLESCTLSANQVSNGGAAVYVYCSSQGSATTTLNQCTVHQNSMQFDGALVSWADGTNSIGQMRLNRCTLAENTAAGYGGAVATFGFSSAISSVAVDGCIIAGNTTAGGAPEVIAGGSGTVTSLGNNLIGKADGGGVTWLPGDLTGTAAAPLNPMLATLGSYGGPTPTMPPLPGSPARDPAGGTVVTASTLNRPDQRGVLREVGSIMDIGSVEAGPADAPGTLAFGGPVARVAEGANPGLIPVYRTAGTIGTVTVNYQTFIAGSAAGFAATNDFSMTSGTLTFLPGQTVANIPIVIASDPAVKEPHENFNLILSSPGGGGILGTQNSTVVRIVDFVDASVPTLTLLTPKAGAIFTAAQGPQIAVTGSAKDDKGIQAVQVQFNGGAFVDAALVPSVPGTSPTFSLAVTAVPGVNNLVVRSLDEKGKVSALLKRSFTYRVISTLTTTINGSATIGGKLVTFGSITRPAAVDKTVPNSAYVGMPCKVTAVPKAGYIFAGWYYQQTSPGPGIPFPPTGITLATRELPALNFIMQPGLALTAYFVPVLQPDTTGTYTGLILPSTTQPAPGGTAARNDTTGLFTLALTSTSGISGTLKMDGISLPFTGTTNTAGGLGTARFGTSRTQTLTFLRKGKPDLELALLFFNYLGENSSILGSLTQKQNGTILTVSNFTATRAKYSAKAKVPATLMTGASQRFNLTFPPVPLEGMPVNKYPQGTGIGSMILGADGAAKFAGTLADNTPFTASAPLSPTNQAPLFVSLYTNKGHFAGIVTVLASSSPDYDTYGVNYLWNRPQQVKAQWYPDGWTTSINLDMVGAQYKVPLASANLSVIPGLGPVDSTNTVGNATLTFMDGLLSSTRSYPVNISTKDVVTPLPLKTKNFTLALNKATGEISGTFTHTDNKKPAFKATTIQKPGDYQGTWGFFMSAPTAPVNGQGQGGSVMLLPGALAAP